LLEDLATDLDLQPQMRVLDLGSGMGATSVFLARVVSWRSPRRALRDLGGIPPHIKACVGWEAMAWHGAEWWQLHITMLEADGGRFLSFALVTARKPATPPSHE